jgi:Domain of unknown function (DUF3854)
LDTTNHTSEPGAGASGGFTRARADDARRGRAALSEKHWRMLNEESGILPEVIFERPYKTVGIETVRACGFSTVPEQEGSNFLEIVLHGVAEGVPTQLQFRPDVPRILKDDNGKPRPVKYEGQPRRPPILDIHPRSLPLLPNTKTPLWVGEGTKKGDSGVSRGLCVINLSGVWSWLHDKIALPDWRLVPLKGRQVFVCFDSDAMTKRNVGRAVCELGGFLELRGATVKVIDWEAKRNG